MVYNTVSGELFSGKDGIKVAVSQSSVLQWLPRLWYESPRPSSPGDVMPELSATKTQTKYADRQFRDYLEDTHQHFACCKKTRRLKLRLFL